MTSSRYPLRLMETFRSVFYTPIYVSLTGGFLENEGLDVTFETCPPQFAHPLSALIHGAADITQSGIMRSIIASDWGAETVPKHVAKINSRDGFFILGRAGQQAFQWEALRGARVIPVGFTPMPWASFQFALRRHGIAPDELQLLPGLSLDEAVATFRDSRADFIHVPEPAAEQLIVDGVAQLAVALGPENGHLAYSSFAATNRFLAENAETVQRFVQGFARALQSLAARDAGEVGQAVAPFFPEIAPELLGQAVARYKSQEQWPSHPALEEPEYEGLQEILIAAGLVREKQPYEKVVSPEFARAVAV